MFYYASFIGHLLGKLFGINFLTRYIIDKKTNESMLITGEMIKRFIFKSSIDTSFEFDQLITSILLLIREKY